MQEAVDHSHFLCPEIVALGFLQWLGLPECGLLIKGLHTRLPQCCSAGGSSQGLQALHPPKCRHGGPCLCGRRLGMLPTRGKIGRQLHRGPGCGLCDRPPSAASTCFKQSLSVPSGMSSMGNILHSSGCMWHQSEGGPRPAIGLVGLSSPPLRRPPHCFLSTNWGLPRLGSGACLPGRGRRLPS